MDIDIKFHWYDNWKIQFTATASGPVDIEGVLRILGVISEKAQPLLDCTVLIDLQNATFTCRSMDVYAIANELQSIRWPLSNKIALVSAPDVQQYDLLLVLCSGASLRGFKVSAFSELDKALAWLAEDD